MGKLHALVFPIPLQGHINPMMMLAAHLNSFGIRVTFLFTERTLSILRTHNIGTTNGSTHKGCATNECMHIHNDSMQKTICHQDLHGTGCGSVENESNLPPIGFETLPDSTSGLENESFLPASESVLLFLDSIPLIRRKLEEILERLQEKGHPATCIISDSFLPWTQDVANKFGIPRMEFWCSSVTVYSMGYHIPRLIDGGYLPIDQPGIDLEFYIDIIPGLAPFKLVDFFYTNAISSPIFDLISHAFSRAKEAQSVLVNSFYELEKDIIDALRTEGVSIEPIGPLIPLQTCEPHAIKLQRGEEIIRVASASLYGDDHEDCLAWLDTQARQSVIYVSFGSMASLSHEEIQELMLGLEASQQPYLLVIRPDMVLGSQKIIPRGTCYICKWAPQIHVLGHPAIAGFLTHCGWNSIMEGMCMGVPMIGCPIEAEQHTNMKCLRDEWKISIDLDPHHHHCQQTELRHCEGSHPNRVKIKKELVERAIRALMQADIGITLRARMQELQCVARCASHMKASSIHRVFEKTQTSGKVLNGESRIHKERGRH